MTTFMSHTTSGGGHNNCHARLIKQGLIAAQDTNFVTDETQELAFGTVWDTIVGTSTTRRPHDWITVDVTQQHAGCRPAAHLLYSRQH